MKSISDYLSPLAERFSKRSVTTLENNFINMHRKLKSENDLKAMLIHLSNLISINTQILILEMRSKK